MRIIDAHCDALLKLQKAKRKSLHEGASVKRYKNANSIETNVERLKKGNVMTQCYAIFIEPNLPSEEKWQHALEQVDLFFNEVISKHPDIIHIKKWEDMKELKDEEIGAILTLEGAESFGNDLMKLRHLYRLGVRSIGLTWNQANLCADGVGEPRGGGLTLLGKEVVSLNNKHDVFTDVAHLSIAGFWDVMELADYPIASHCNARAVCEHPRNLYDEQVKAMVANQGLIHVVFYPPFIKEGRDTATIGDLIKHIDHLCALGGEKHIGFGSDFDGIDKFVTGLENTSAFPHLINELLQYYSEEQVRGFAYQNFLTHMPG